MPYLRDRTDRGKAAALVVALHAALGAALLWGLAGGSAKRAVDALKSFDVLEPPPPAREEPPLQPAPAAARDEPAPPDLKARPAPAVVPPPAIPLPIPSPVPTADESAPVTGADPSAGAAAMRGPGTGAGGTGSGFGGGGSGGSGSGGDGGGLGSEARLLRGMQSRLDGRLLATLAGNRGELPMALTVGPAGRVIRCTPLGTTGNPVLDGELCRRMAERSRWIPARDRTGRPVPVSVRYTATWSRN